MQDESAEIVDQINAKLNESRGKGMEGVSKKDPRTKRKYCSSRHILRNLSAERTASDKPRLNFNFRPLNGILGLNFNESSELFSINDQVPELILKLKI